MMYVTLRELRAKQEAEAVERARERDEYEAAKRAAHRAQIAADPGVQAVQARIAARAEERAALGRAKVQAVLDYAKAEVDAAVQAERVRWVQTNGSDEDFDEKATRRRIALERVKARATDSRVYRPRL